VTAILGAIGAIGNQSSAHVSIANQTVFDSSGIHSSTATAIYTISSDGNVRNQASAVLESWLVGLGGSVGNYDVRATLTSGTLSSGTTGSWLNCSTSRSWSVANSAGDNSTVTAVIFVEIRLTSSGVVQDTATITLQAESNDYGGGGGGHF
jgi:hypothetical protein